ncbi:VWA domain-containing protein, partial [Novipirellula sp.]|uniref:vWA domain-containing protein n=1 Tax=Novipirellula sp. TaxID=2795430 RepID=UPI0035689E07
MNQEPNKPLIDPELEARIVALVLGEASDFERDQLQRLIDEKAELAAFKDEIERVHGLMRDVGNGEWDVKDKDWKLPAEKRDAVLAFISGETTEPPVIRLAGKSGDQPSKSVGRSRSKRRWVLGNIAKVAAVLLIVGFGVSMFLPSIQYARVASRHQDARMSADSFFDSSESMDGEDLLSDYDAFMTEDAVSGPASEDHFGSAATKNVEGREYSNSSKSALSAIRESLSQNANKALPSPYYLQDDIQYLPSGPEFKLQKSEAELQEKLWEESESVSPRQADNGRRPELSQPIVGDFAVSPHSVTSSTAVEFSDEWGARTSSTFESGAKDFRLPSAGDSKLTSPVIAGLAMEELRKAGQPESSSEPASRGLSVKELEQPLSEQEPDVVVEGFPARTGRIMLGATVNRDAGDSGQVSSADDFSSGLRGGTDLYFSNGGSNDAPVVGVERDMDEAETSIWVDDDGDSRDDGANLLGTPREKNEKKKNAVRIAENVSGSGPAMPNALGDRFDIDSVRIAQSEKSKRDESLRRYGESPADSPGPVYRYVEPSIELGKMRELQTKEPVRTTVAPTASPAGLDEKNAAEEAFSTFSLHVSDVSFKLARASLANGSWPEAAKVRIEEFVNAFDYGDPMPSQSEKVACRVEQSIHPFLQQRNLLRVSMRTAAAGRASHTPLRLTFLLDNSGSMERVDRQQTVRRAFALLAQQLNTIDQVTLISFARQPRLLADKVSGDQSSRLVELVENLPSEGGTNLEAALQLAFEKAQEQRIDNAQNRIILLTDGAVNLGDANPDRLSQMIATMRSAGIAFDAAGISADGLNDEILEALACKGDGRYYLLDSHEAADEEFASQIAGALRPSAKNVKVQVEFNPKRVGRYKLLGFEKLRLKQQDFRNDNVDAAEMAAAEAGVALYQFEAKP